MFILSIQIAFAMFGGESEVIYSFEECLNLTVNVNASLHIDDGEFSFLNCSKINQSYWFCNCSNNFNLVLTTKPNTVNSYSFDIFYYAYSKPIEEEQTFGGGSSSSGGSGAFTIRFLSNQSRVLMLNLYAVSRFWIDGGQHTIKVIEVGDGWINLIIESEPKNITLYINESQEIQLGNETLELTLRYIRGKISFIEFKKVSKPAIKEMPIEIINETIDEIEQEPEQEAEEEQEEAEEEKVIGKIIYFLIPALFIILFFIVIKLAHKVGKKKRYKSSYIKRKK